MKLYAFLLVLLSAFCAAFARYDITNAERRSALLRTGGGGRLARALKSVDDDAVATIPLDDNEDEEDEEDKPDTEDDFDEDDVSIDGESDDECPTGIYTLKYISKQRFSSGTKYKRVKANSLHACGTACAKNKSKCGTFNWSKSSKQCQMFTTKNIGRDKVADNAATAAYLACVE